MDATRRRCPVCGAVARAEQIDVSSEGQIRYMAGQLYCPNGHQPGTPEWGAAIERQGLLDTIRNAIDGPELHGPGKVWLYNYGDAAETVLAAIEAAGFTVVHSGNPSEEDRLRALVAGLPDGSIELTGDGERHG